ncbi:MAG: DUF2752 domain-containing protein [Clostridia bacterium]|nr:DUF2752 domain-containing protein [Clostridia bacterium]
MDIPPAVRRLQAFLRSAALPLAATAIYSAAAWAMSGTPCLLQSATGLPCPGCGLTRAVRLALQGDTAGAFRMHPLFPVAVAVLVALPVIAWRAPSFLRTRTFRTVAVAVIGLFLAVYVWRMATLFSGTPPMVYNMDSFLGRILRLTGLSGRSPSP